MNPGLGSPCCPRCFCLLKPNLVNSESAINPVLHRTTAVTGFCLGGLLSAVHSFNTGFPHLQGNVKGPKWLPFVVGMPVLLLCSGAAATFGGEATSCVGDGLIEISPQEEKDWVASASFALPKFAQLTITSYYVTSSASHYGVSLLT